MSDDAPVIISHEKAKAAGLKHFFTGKPCRRGHVALRTVRENGCVECQKIAHAASRARAEERYEEERVAAKAAGLKRYFTGKPCKHGHIAERLVSCGLCVECSKASVSAYRGEGLDEYEEAQASLFDRGMVPERPTDIITRKDAMAAGLLHYFTGKPCKNGHIAARTVSRSTCCECHKGVCLAYAKNNRPKVNEALNNWRANNRDWVGFQAKCYRLADPEKHRRLKKEWRAKNPNAEKAGKVRWRKANPEKVKAHKLADQQRRDADTQRRARHLAAKTADYLANIERYKAYARKYEAENREKVRANHRAMVERNREYYNKKSREWSKANPDKRKAMTAKRRALERSAAGSCTIADIQAIHAAQNGCCAYCRKKLAFAGNRNCCVDHIVPLARGGTNDRRNLQILCRSCNSKKWALDPIEFAQRIGRLL
jgi:5-methylcytosine-specific restriction endonuclease McrA